MKTILILGGGFGQIPAIKKAKEFGLCVVCIDRNPHAVGMSLADYAYDFDIIDFDGALAIAKKHKVDGVMTMQSDLPVPTVGYINDCLGLKGVSLEVANVCSNKTKTREKLAEKMCAQPNFKIIDNIHDAQLAADEIGYPCVIKAPDSSGSRGVVKVKTPTEVNQAFEEAILYSRTGQVLVEEYIDGIEFGAQTFSIDGKCELILMHNDTLSEPPYMIPVGHSFPFYMLNKEDERIAESDIKNAVNALGITDGPANIDLILDTKTRRVKIIEVGARIGATCLPELVEYHTGIDWVKQSIYSALGMVVDLTIEKKQPVAAMIITSPDDGIFTGYKVNYDPRSKDLIEFEITTKYGDEVNKLRKGTDRMGKVLTTGNDVVSAEANVKYICNSIECFIQKK